MTEPSLCRIAASRPRPGFAPVLLMLAAACGDQSAAPPGSTTDAPPGAPDAVGGAASSADGTAPGPVAGDVPAAARGTAIRNVTVIDAVNGVRENTTVVFEGDAITAIVPATQVVAAANDIDGSGRYLIPGLWDFHVHLTYDERFTAAMPELFLSWGITSVRDTGGLIDEVSPVVEAMRAVGAVASRVFFAGPLLDGEHVVYDGGDRPEIGVRVATPDDARRIVRELVDQGVNFVKVYEMLAPETFAAIVESARAVDLAVDSHVPLSMRARDAGPLVDSIEHLRNVELDCAATPEVLYAERLTRLTNPDGLSGGELRASLHALQRLPAIEAYDETECDAVIAALTGTTMVPTLRLNAFPLWPSYEREDWVDALARTPPSVQSDWGPQGDAQSGQSEGDTTFADWSLFLTGRMHAAGVPFAAGTDTPINFSIPGYSLHEELEMLVRAGLTELEALQAATLEPAEWFSLEGILGSIDVGKRADMVLLDADPLADITNSKRIALVISKGRVWGQ